MWIRWLGRRCSLCQGAPKLRDVQQHLADGESATAWALGEELCSSDPNVLRSAEANTVMAVAAAATGRLDTALEYLRSAAEVVDPDDSCYRVLSPSPRDCAEERGIRSIAERVEMLMSQSCGEGDLFTGENLGVAPLLDLQVPRCWSSWCAALPKVAEFAGPVEIRWTFGAEGGTTERGLYSTRRVACGEVLLIARPIAAVASTGEGSSTDALVRQLMDTCSVSARARQQLESLSDGWSSRAQPSLLATTEALHLVPDLPPTTPLSDTLLDEKALTGIVDRNSFNVNGKTFIYGLPSMINHSCGSRNASANILDPLGDAILFRAEKDIEAGSEILFSYFKVAGSLRRREKRSMAMGFRCACERCAFEMHLPGSTAAEVYQHAVAVFERETRPKLQELLSHHNHEEDVPSLAACRCQALRDILELTRKVADAANPSWSAPEVAWYLHLILPLTSSGLMCCLPSRNKAKAETPEPYSSELLSGRVELLFQIVLAWEHTELHGYDHLKYLHLLWLALEELHSAGSLLPRSWLRVHGPTVPIWRLADSASSNRTCTRDLLAEMKNRCEIAFCQKFGVGRRFLSMGKADCQIAGLLETMRM